jgi:4-hydroxy-tetrahydrodipicolinate synthase
MGENIRFVSESGVHGFITNGSVGEFYQTTFDEFKKIVDVGVESAGKAAYVAGCNWQNTAECIARTKYAEDAGADAAMIIPPYYMGSPGIPYDDTYEHYKAVHEATDEIQILVYNNPSLSKVNLKPEFWDRLVGFDRVVATKESPTDIVQTSELIRRHGHRINVLAGFEPQLLPMMLMGGKGCVSIWGSSRPKAVLEFYNACANRELEKAVKMHMLFSEEGWRIIETTSQGKTTWAAYFKGLNEIAGRTAGPPRKPYRPLSEELRSLTREWLKRLDQASSHS